MFKMDHTAEQLRTVISLQRCKIRLQVTNRKVIYVYGLANNRNSDDIL